MKTQLITTIRLGSQVERTVCKQHHQRRYKQVEGGESFASLFPELVGSELVLGQKGIELAGKPRLMEAVAWLSHNGYFKRGGNQR